MDCEFMKFDKFEDILAWQKSMNLVVEIYVIANKFRDYSFKDQLLRAVVSIMNNIAEGFERKTNSEFKHFLFIAKGSCGEVRSMLHLALNLKYITDEQHKVFINKSEEISKMLSGLIKTL